MSKWLGRTSEEFEGGLPHRSYLPNKPEPLGCQIKTLCCSESKIILQIEIVESGADMREKEGSEISAGAGSVLRLTAPWTGSGRVVVGDSAFASVKTAATLFVARGLDFLGQIKNGTKGFPVQEIKKLNGLGQTVSLTATVKVGQAEVPLRAFGWQRKFRHMFVSTSVGTSIISDKVLWKIGAQRVEVPAPHVAKLFYQHAPKIDRHNFYRQYVLAMEESWKTHRWEVRVFTTLFAMVVVNAFYAFLAERFPPAFFFDKAPDFQTFVLSLLDQCWPPPPAVFPIKDLPALVPNPTTARGPKRVTKRTCSVCSQVRARYTCNRCDLSVCGASTKRKNTGEEDCGATGCFVKHLVLAHGFSCSS